MSAPTERRQWTDAHRREAFVRLGELAIEARVDGLGDTAQTLGSLMYPYANEIVLREALADERLDGFGPARIDREIALVRERAERPTARSTRIDTAIEHLRTSFVEDTGAGGEVLLLCREIEHQRGDIIRAHEEIDDLRSKRIRPCVAALVTDPAGRLLLVRTKRGWELPGGGMEPGETWRAGLLRELGEEAGLDVILDPGEPRVFDGMPVAAAQYQSLIVIARGTATGEPRPQAGDGVHEARWFAAVDVPMDGLSQIANAQVVREWVAEALALRWTPPPGVHPTVLHGDATGPLLIALVTLDPGAEVPREVHEGQSETIIPLTGRLEIEDGTASPSWQTEHDSAPIVIDPGTPHVIRNASSSEPAVFLAVLRRVGSDVGDTEPAPAVVPELTPAQIAALRLCVMPAEPWSAWKRAKARFEAEHGYVLWETMDLLERMGLALDGGDATPAGCAVLAAIDSAGVPESNRSTELEARETRAFGPPQSPEGQ